MNRWFYFTVILLFISFWIFSIAVYVLMKLNPEVEMVLNSQCKNPVRGWDGKVFSIEVWNTGLLNNTGDFYVQQNIGHNSKDRRRLKDSNENNNNTSNDSKNLRYGLNPKKGGVRPVIYWGTHHKTGTYIAQKTFALLCARQKWCCVFHPTRASIHSILESLETEIVHALGIYIHPNDIGIAYKFVDTLT